MNESCLLMVRESFNELSEQEKKLAHLILDNPRNLLSMGISETAKAAGVSTSTVIRFCKHIGFGGYKEMCRSLYSDLANGRDCAAIFNIYPSSEISTIIDTVRAASVQAIENTVALLNVEQLQKAVDVISQAKRVDCYGLGASGVIAMDASSKLNRIGKVSCSYMDHHYQMVSILSLRPEDAVLLFSNSGETAAMIVLAKKIKLTGAKLITITRHRKNTISELGDVNLFISSHETAFRAAAMTSRIAQSFVVDLLFTTVCSNNFDNVRDPLNKSITVSSQLHEQE